MRISDWSSDVCSSDLLEICQVMRHRGGGNAATLRNLARHQPIGSRLHEHAENRQPCFVPKGLQGIDGPDLIALRSEEHTSELQSLMRISYAVFCLKKKKHSMQVKMNKE